LSQLSCLLSSSSSSSSSSSFSNIKPTITATYPRELCTIGCTKYNALKWNTLLVVILHDTSV
jgi:hypothetical protein